MGSKKKSAPEYSSSKADTGIWGSSTHSKKGTTYTAPEWMSSTMGTVTSNINPTLNNMLSSDYSNDANFQAYQNQLYNTMGQQYDQMLGNLASRGLMNSSGAQALNNNYAKALQDNVTALYDNYYNRNNNTLANLLNTSNTLFDYVMGVNGLSRGDSQALNEYNLAKYRLENGGSSNIGSIIGGLGNIAGAAAQFKGSGGA
jgi:hypothetical protein